MIDRGELPLGARLPPDCRRAAHPRDDPAAQARQRSARLLRAEIRRGRSDRFASAWQSIKRRRISRPRTTADRIALTREGLLRVDVLLHRFFLDSIERSIHIGLRLKARLRLRNSTHVRIDAIVIGGVPADLPPARLLAEYGHKVLLLEREPFPRYHIGESLIPYTWFTLNRLGVVDWLRQSACPKKYSVQFVSITGKVSQPFYFFQTIKHECAQTWQVWRSEFDQMLLDNAVRRA
jgi:hypothetical protein